MRENHHVFKDLTANVRKRLKALESVYSDHTWSTKWAHEMKRLKTENFTLHINSRGGQKLQIPKQELPWRRPEQQAGMWGGRTPLFPTWHLKGLGRKSLHRSRRRPSSSAAASRYAAADKVRSRRQTGKFVKAEVVDLLTTGMSWVRERWTGELNCRWLTPLCWKKENCTSLESGEQRWDSSR